MRLVWNARTLRHLVAAGLAAAALYACTLGVNWGVVLDAFRGAYVPWVGVAVVSVLLTLALATSRWGLFVAGGSGRKRWRVLWDAVVLGQAVNIVAPLRFGEGARLALTCRGLDLPLGRVTVGLAAERACDMAAFTGAVFLSIAAGWMPKAFAGLVPATVSLVMVATVVIVVAARWAPAGVGVLGRRVGLPAPVVRWLALQQDAARSGWADLVRGPRLAAAALLTALILAMAASTNLLIIRAFHLQVPAVTALVLLLVLQAGTALVSVPGNVGVFHYLTVATLAAWEVPPPTALALAIVLHAVSLGPKVVLGAILLVATPSFAKALIPQVSPP